MGNVIQVTTNDGHKLDAYQARGDTPKGSLVIIQEIFGVNAHIRELCDRFASFGYNTLAPALFDRVERGIELDYDEQAFVKARQIRSKIDIDKSLEDIKASVGVLAKLSPSCRIGISGYCWGGTLAWLAATRLDNISATVCYYGGQIHEYIDEDPKCPVIMNFGENDTGIPLTTVDKIRKAKANIPVHIYPNAEHGFSCDHRGSYNAKQANIAEQRTLAFFDEHLC